MVFIQFIICVFLALTGWHCVYSTLPLQRSTSCLLDGLVPAPFCCCVIWFQSGPVLPDSQTPRLCGAGCTIRCPQNEMGCFITSPLQWQLSPRHPHTLQREIQCSPHVRRCASVAGTGRKAVHHETEQRHWRGNQKYPPRYVMEISQECTLFTQFNWPTVRRRRDYLHGLLRWHEGEHCSRAACGPFILNFVAHQILRTFHDI